MLATGKPSILTSASASASASNSASASWSSSTVAAYLQHRISQTAVPKTLPSLTGSLVLSRFIGYANAFIRDSFATVSPFSLPHSMKQRRGSTRRLRRSAFPSARSLQLPGHTACPGYRRFGADDLSTQLDAQPRPPLRRGLCSKSAIHSRISTPFLSRSSSR
eukprot:scaffold1638_cov258-Pinguiococcus_pyrenoidosus.AAC.28